VSRQHEPRTALAGLLQQRPYLLEVLAVHLHSEHLSQVAALGVVGRLPEPPMAGHEWTYLVRGNATKLRPGMCFSDEPGI
jgi:Xaa-Pro aminopeptidase